MQLELVDALESGKFVPCDRTFDRVSADIDRLPWTMHAESPLAIHRFGTIVDYDFGRPNFAFGNGCFVIYYRTQLPQVGTVDFGPTIDVADTVVDPKPEVALPRSKTLVETIDNLRAISRLPVHEVAEMVGLQRRALYKIMKENSTSVERQTRIYNVDEILHELELAFDGDRNRVRAALLAPLAPFQGQSFTKVAAVSKGDVATMRTAVEYLLGEDGRERVEWVARRNAPLTSESTGTMAMATKHAMVGLDPEEEQTDGDRH